jgi:hypothetical protein
VENGNVRANRGQDVAPKSDDNVCGIVRVPRLIVSLTLDFAMGAPKVPFSVLCHPNRRRPIYASGLADDLAIPRNFSGLPNLMKYSFIGGQDLYKIFLLHRSTE